MAMTHGNLAVHEVDSDQELYAIWPVIRSGINQIEKRCKGVFYRPEDVYHAIKGKQAILLIATIDHRYQGFAVLKIEQHPDGNGIHIWTMHNAGKDKAFVANFLKIIEQIASLMKAMRVSYSSSRAGWLRKAEKLGYRSVASLHYFEREVSP